MRSRSKFSKFDKNRRRGPNRSNTSNNFINNLCPHSQIMKSEGLVVSKKCEQQSIKIGQYNILDIDNMIKQYLKNKIENINEPEQELAKCDNIINGESNDDDIYQKIIAHERKDKIVETIQDLETTSTLLLYNYKTKNIIEKYKELKKQCSNNFIVVKSDDCKLIRNIEDIKNTFINIAKDYCPLSGFIQNAKTMICEECDSTEFELKINEESIYYCIHCGLEIEKPNDSPTYKDTDRVNMSQRYKYSKEEHFIDAINRFQGQQNFDKVKMNKIVDILKNEMEKHKLIPQRGNKRSITKKQLYLFLKEYTSNDLQKHYADINLLFFMITGEKCPNINHLKSELIKLFREQENMYIKMKDDGEFEDERTNSLNVYYKLYKLLQRLNYKCKREDFICLKTKEREDNHDIIMRKVWDRLGWKWIQT